MVLERPGPIAAQPLRATEREAPRAGPGEIVLSVAACGVCRTDLQICEGELAARTLPVVPGHQIVGTVLEIGQGVSAWKVGDRAGVAWLASACGHCEPCRAGAENLCRFACFTGWDRDGGYAERVAVRADFALRLPDGFSDLDAAPLLCGGVIGYRSLKRARVVAGCRLGLFGFGASASLAIQVARHWGCRVFVATRSAAERARALDLGAEWAGGYDDAMPEPLESAVTFAPSGDVVRTALRALDRGGTLAINAIHLDRVPELPYEELWWERTICSVANFTREDAKELMELAARIPVRTTYEVHPLEAANTALQRVRAGDVRGAAVLVPAGRA
jgi:propanol-preferring alcohol dehydrogenase